MINKVKLKIKGFDSYRKKLFDQMVFVEQRDRLLLIKYKLLEICQRMFLYALYDEKLYREISNFIEFPYISIGNIKKEFFLLPKEILIHIINYYQKYIVLKDEKDQLSPYIIIISNIMTNDSLKTIVKGNEKVLKSRFKDVNFFYNNDIAFSLISNLPYINRIIYHYKAGSYTVKINKIKKLSLLLADQVISNKQLVVKACQLIKLDLVSQMVNEFPILKGIIGYHYSCCSEIFEISLPVKKHYFPLGSVDNFSNCIFSIIISLADKIITLNIMFYIGLYPSNSNDPYALRRSAIGLIRIICVNKICIHKFFILFNVNALIFIIKRLQQIRKNNVYNINLNYFSRLFWKIYLCKCKNFKNFVYYVFYIG